MELPRWLKRGERKAAWETTPVQLNPEAAILVGKKLEEIGNPLGFGGTVTALRLIESSARTEFGPLLTDIYINPLPPGAITYLINKGALDLSSSNLQKAYEEHRNS